MKRASAIKLILICGLALVLPVLERAGDASDSPRPFEIKMPRGIPQELWAYFIPQDNPMSDEKVELGRKLFFDRRLSADGRISCASCHDPERAFTDGKKVSEGIGGRLGTRNAPTLLNAMFNTGQFWDGRASTLEEQSKMPLINPDEMGNRSHDEVVTRLAALPEYAKSFEQIFGRAVTIEAVAKAIAAFERTLVSGDSPVDKYFAGDIDAMSESARSGLALFRGKARCGICHGLNQNFGAFSTFPFFTDGNYRNTGVAANFGGFDDLYRRAITASREETGKSVAALAKHDKAGELGRFILSGNALDIGAFRTPSLRNVALTAPYFHDGSAATLEEVVRYYQKGGNYNLNRDWQLEPVVLTESEQHDLIDFLKALTSDDARRPGSGR